MIPKIIHQMWIGPKAPPQEWMDTWRETMPDWEYRLWTEVEIDQILEQSVSFYAWDLRPHYQWFYERGIFYGCSDVVSPLILLHHGGFYTGADTVCLRSFDDAPWIHTSTGAVLAQAREWNRLQNGVWGSRAWHPHLVAMVDQLRQLPVTKEALMPAHVKVGGTLLWDVVQTVGNVEIVPRCTFFPFDSAGVPAPVEGPTYSSHFWGSTHDLY